MTYCWKKIYRFQTDSKIFKIINNHDFILERISVMIFSFLIIKKEHKKHGGAKK